MSTKNQTKSGKLVILPSIGTRVPDPDAKGGACKVALYNAPGFLAIERAKAALALLRKIDPLYMDFTCAGMTEDDFGEWAQSIAEDAIADSLARAEREIADAVLGVVHPPLGEPVTHGEREADCPVCGAAILYNAVEAACNRCDTRMHSECFFGRVATLDEWHEYIRNVNGGPEDYAPTVLCPQCRAKGEPA